MAKKKTSKKKTSSLRKPKDHSAQKSQIVPKKEIKAYFLRLGVRKGDKVANKKYLTPEEVLLLLKGISTLELSKGADVSRYSKDPDDPICLLTEADNRRGGLTIPKRTGFLAGAVFKQRRSNYPFEDDGEALLMELNLGKDTHFLAEVAYWLANIETGILAFHSNRYVGGKEKLAAYLTEKWGDYLKISTGLKPAERNLLQVPNGVGRIFVDFIPNTNAIEEFEGMKVVRRLELGLSGRPTDLDDLLDSKDSTQKRTARALDPTQWLRGDRIGIKISGENLDEGAIKSFFQSLRAVEDTVLKRFTVYGEIDDDTRVLDLVDDLLSYNEPVPVSGRYLRPEKVFDILEKGYNHFLDRFEEV